MKKAVTMILSIFFVLATILLASSNPVTKKFYMVNSIQMTPQIIEGKQYLTKMTNPLQPVIDGRLVDSVWDMGEWEGGFIQSVPYEGQAPSQKTVFKILYDGKNIYVAIKAFDDEPDKIERRLARRDNLEGDRVSILIMYF